MKHLGKAFSSPREAHAHYSFAACQPFCAQSVSSSSSPEEVLSEMCGPLGDKDKL